jgi:membrane protein
MRVRKRELVAKFFADRGTHLAAMIAYFALISFVPLVFIALSLFGLAHRADASDFFVKELQRAFPGSSLESILKLVHRVQDNAAVLGIVGVIGLIWSSLSLFSALESALNIVYDRPNRSFLQGKAIATAFMVGTITALFVSLVVGGLGVQPLRHAAPGLNNAALAYVLSIGVSLGGIFLFLLLVYRYLPNTEMTMADALPGAAGAALILEASFQVLPIFVRFADVNVTLRVLGGPVLLLIWLYVMANVIVFGAEVNWWTSRRRRVREEGAREAPVPTALGASSVPSTRSPARRP